MEAACEKKFTLLMDALEMVQSPVIRKMVYDRLLYAMIDLQSLAAQAVKQ